MNRDHTQIDYLLSKENDPRFAGCDGFLDAISFDQSLVQALVYQSIEDHPQTCTIKTFPKDEVPQESLRHVEDDQPLSLNVDVSIDLEPSILEDLLRHPHSDNMAGATNSSYTGTPYIHHTYLPDPELPQASEKEAPTWFPALSTVNNDELEGFVSAREHGVASLQGYSSRPTTPPDPSSGTEAPSNRSDQPRRRFPRRFSQSEKSREFIDSLDDMDVVFFQGNRSHASRGTRAYLQMVKEQQPNYGRTKSRKEKAAYKRLIMNCMQEAGSRFVREERGTGRYYLLTEKELLQAIANSLWYACFKNKKQKATETMNQDTERAEYA